MRDINQYEKDYMKSDFEIYQVKMRRKRVLESIRGRKRILEIGCGTESLFMYIDWEIEEYTVVEPGKEFIEYAKKRIVGENTIRFLNECFSANEAVLSKKYDAIVCSSLLHEIEKPGDMLEDIAAACTKQTLVHINVPNANSFHRLLAKEMGIINEVKQFSERNKKLQQNTVYTIDELKEQCIAAGFSIVSSGSYFIKPFTHDQMYRMMVNGILDENVLEGLYKMTEYMPEAGAEIYVDCMKQGE